MDSVTILGLIGGALTTSSFFPQVIKAWKTKSTGDVSIGMFLLLAAGIFIWTIYGFMIGSLPVIAANIISFILSVTVIAFKVIYK
ncbi:MAG: SemiSWEET transporter [Deltaproteobacteria bacterium]|nr:SemiSWEET transporter [Deltaproteobacteria bacterium]